MSEYYDLHDDNPINQRDEPRELTDIEELQYRIEDAERLIDQFRDTNRFLIGKLAKVALLMQQHTKHGGLSPEEWIELKELVEIYKK